jgi:hypothetical protein
VTGYVNVEDLSKGFDCSELARHIKFPFFEGASSEQRIVVDEALRHKIAVFSIPARQQNMAVPDFVDFRRWDRDPIDRADAKVQELPVQDCHLLNANGIPSGAIFVGG